MLHYVMATYRAPVDGRLDKLYNSRIRCPYCKTVIPKYDVKCANCGLTKKQITEASNIRAKEVRKTKSGEKILMTKTKPDDVSFTKMIIWLLLGIFGAHNFYVGRKIRGWIMVGFMVTFIAFCIILPINPDNMHPWRQAFSGSVFPTDLLGAAAFFVWVYDAFGVVFGFYKYPVKI